jgi:tRNA(fMet)-specific endonuclease VapC
MRVMLDTNVCSYLIKGQSPWIEAFTKSDTGDFAISSMVAYELAVWKNRNPADGALARLIAAFLEAVVVLPFDAGAAKVSGQVVARLVAARVDIGAMDPLIAGHAMSENAVLITNNEKHFKKVDGLKFATSL